MEKLRHYSLKGWHVRGFQFMGYTLEKGEQSDYVYSVDYRLLSEDEEEEYFDFFLSSGWSHVASEGHIHLFRAHSGTKPIYTDRDTTVEKYKNSNHTLKKLAIPLVLITALLWGGTIISSGGFKSFFLVAAYIFSVIAIPIAWTVMETFSRKLEVEGREKLANLIKLTPYLLSLLAITILLFFISTDIAVKGLMYMIIGAIALPASIWIIMSLYHKVIRK